MAEALLEMKDVEYKHKISSPRILNPFFKVEGLGIENISMNLISGNIVGLVGPNGAGKTTLMKILSGLLIPKRGVIKINGEEIKNDFRPNWAKKFIGMMPENINWYGNSTPYQEIKKILTIRNMKTKNINFILEQVGLKLKSHETLNSLSQGMHQRLSLACALIGNPKILLLDEPMNGLDPVAREAFAKILKNLANNGRTILISSHQLAELERMVDSIILMHDGEIIEKGKLVDIRNKYKIHNDLILKFKDKVANLDKIILNKKSDELMYKQIKKEGFYSVIINAPKKGWSIEQKTEILNQFILNGNIPFEYSSSKIELVEILSAVTGLNAINIGMNLQRKNKVGEEE